MSLPLKVACLLGAVLSISIAGCSSGAPKISAELNQNASLVGDLPTNPLQWKIITSAINTADSTMSTLYGNDLAVTYARTHSQHDYPSGSILCLVTWAQRDDARYFGAKIPDQPRFVEFLFVNSATGGRPSYSYQQFTGAPLRKQSAPETSPPNERATYLLSQRAAVMP